MQSEKFQQKSKNQTKLALGLLSDDRRFSFVMVSFGLRMKAVGQSLRKVTVCLVILRSQNEMTMACGYCNPWRANLIDDSVGRTIKFALLGGIGTIVRISDWLETLRRATYNYTDIFAE